MTSVEHGMNVVMTMIGYVVTIRWLWKILKQRWNA